MATEIVHEHPTCTDHPCYDPHHLAIRNSPLRPTATDLALGRITDELRRELVQRSVNLLAAMVAWEQRQDVVSVQDPEPSPPTLAGHLCEACLDAPAVTMQEAPWGGEMGVCQQCTGRKG